MTPPHSSPSPPLSLYLRASISTHLPILFTSKTHSPYLPIPHPTLGPNRLSLTLPLASDVPSQVLTLSHERVWRELEAPPHPYTERDAEEWNTFLLARWDRCVARWREGDFSPQVLGESGCPLGVIRLARKGEEQGEGEAIGDFGVSRWEFKERPEGEGERAKRENGERLVGDPGLVWSFGYFLSPSHHSRGILTSLLRHLLLHWFLPPHILHAQQIRSAAFEGNFPSRRVQEKCGFRMLYRDQEGEETYEKPKEEGREVVYEHQVVESKGGGRRRVWCLGWREENDGPLEARFE